MKGSVFVFVFCFYMIWKTRYAFKYMLLTVFYFRLVWVMGKPRKLNSKAAFTQRWKAKLCVLHVPRTSLSIYSKPQRKSPPELYGRGGKLPPKDRRGKSVFWDLLMTLNNFQLAIRDQCTCSILKVRGKTSCHIWVHIHINPPFTINLSDTYLVSEVADTQVWDVFLSILPKGL